jgi:hypothetical protein
MGVLSMDYSERTGWRSRFWRDWEELNLVERLATFATFLALGLNTWMFADTVVGSRGGLGAVGLAVQSGLLLLILVVWLSRAERKLGKEREQRQVLVNRHHDLLNSFGHAFHDLSHFTRDLFIIGPEEISIDKTVETLIKYCQCIRIIFEKNSLVQREFHVTMKLFSDEGIVITVARDPAALDNQGSTSIIKRKNDTPAYVTENSDFQTLLSKDRIVFACDNLPELAKCGMYTNTSSDWCQRYDAAMVVPIRKKDATPEGRFEIAGYIGVDCWAGGDRVFCDAHGGPDPAWTQVLLAFADSAFGVVKRGRLVDASKGSALVGKDYVIDPENFEFARQLNHELCQRERG